MRSLLAGRASSGCISLLAALAAGCGVPTLEFPALDRLDAAADALGAPEQPDARVWRLNEGVRIPGRWSFAGRFQAAPAFAPAPWTNDQLGLVLAALLGRPLREAGATLSFDALQEDRLHATDGAGRVVELVWTADSAIASSVRLHTGFDASLPREWSVHAARVGGLELRAEGATPMTFAWERVRGEG